MTKRIGVLLSGRGSNFEALADTLKTCRTLVWNGPLGAFETPPFDAATMRDRSRPQQS